MMTFRYEFEDDRQFGGRLPAAVIEYTTEAVTLGEILDAFRDFLRGCGYGVEGRLEVVEGEE
jgi:hypothetical protein